MAGDCLDRNADWGNKFVKDLQIIGKKNKNQPKKKLKEKSECESWGLWHCSSVSLFHLFDMSCSDLWTGLGIAAHAGNVSKACACVCMWETEGAWGAEGREGGSGWTIRVQTQRHSCDKILVCWESQSGRDGGDLTKEFSKMFPGANTVLNNTKRFCQKRNKADNWI